MKCQRAQLVIQARHIQHHGIVLQCISLAQTVLNFTGILRQRTTCASGSLPNDFQPQEPTAVFLWTRKSLKKQQPKPCGILLDSCCKAFATLARVNPGSFFNNRFNFSVSMYNWGCCSFKIRQFSEVEIDIVGTAVLLTAGQGASSRKLNSAQLEGPRMLDFCLPCSPPALETLESFSMRHLRDEATCRLTHSCTHRCEPGFIKSWAWSQVISKLNLTGFPGLLLANIHQLQPSMKPKTVKNRVATCWREYQFCGKWGCGGSLWFVFDKRLNNDERWWFDCPAYTHSLLLICYVVYRVTSSTPIGQSRESFGVHAFPDLTAKQASESSNSIPIIIV